MKKHLIQIFCIILLLYYSSTIAYASFKELWKGNFDYKIEKLLSIDLNKNGINEILIGRYKNLNLLEWNKDTFINRWQSPEFKRAVDFEYYEFNNFLLVKKYNPQNKPIIPYKYRPIIPHTLLYKDGKYVLKEIEETQIPSWQGEKYIISGSFKKRGAHDVIITSEKAQEFHLYLREAKPPNKILWKSPFTIYKYGVVPLFGDFDNDKKIELLIALYKETKVYWISPKGKKFETKEIKKTKSHKNTYIFPLSSSNPERYFKTGRSTSKDFDELFFIDALYYVGGGPLFRAVWQKERFKVQAILIRESLEKDKGGVGYENLNLADIDNDGLDEIIISEIRGDMVQTPEEPRISNRHDVIHILKWNGKEYKKIWTSQSFGAITEVLVDDVTGDGKKDIVVGNEEGEIHIFGQN